MRLQDGEVAGVHQAPSDFPGGKEGQVLAPAARESLYFFSRRTMTTLLIGLASKWPDASSSSHSFL
jgi:hypothetical protein